MTSDAQQLMAAALKTVSLTGSFAPAEVGAKVGLDKRKSEAAARDLSNAGVLVLGFDTAAEFSPDFRKAHTRTAPKAAAKKTKKVRQLT